MTPRVSEFLQSEEFTRHSDVDWAWLAGMIDADGYVALAKQGNAATRRCRSPETMLTPKVNIGQSDPLAVGELKRFPKFTSAPTVRTEHTNRPHYHLNWTSAKAVAIAHKLAPFARGEKKRKLEILIEWGDTVAPRGTYGRGRPYPEHLLEKRRALIAEMDSLKAPRRKRRERKAS